MLAVALSLCVPAGSGEDEVRQLAQQAGSAQSAFALDRLIELATRSEDPAIARLATEALPAFGEGGDRALERVLRDAISLPARAAALDLCVARRHPEDLGLFVELASGTAPTALRMQALDALASDREALPLLEPMLRSNEMRVQAKVLRLLGAARRPAALERAREILLPETRFGAQLKIAAVEVLRDDGGPDSIRRLVATAGHELGEVQDFALKSLLVMDRGAVLLLVVPMLSPTAPADDALVALDVLTRVDVAEVAEIRQAVRSALDHPDAEVRASAIRALGALRDVDALPALERAAASSDASVSGAAIVALSGLRRGDPAWREKLRRMVHSPRPALRLAAVRSLGTLADEPSLPLFLKLLDDDSWRVREATGEALYHLRAKAAVGPLIERLDRERMRVRATYVRALRRTTAMPFRDVARDWQRWWSDARADFVVPPLSQAEAMEARLAQSAAQAPTRATFYGIPVQSDHLALVIDISGSMAETDVMASDPAATAAGDRPAPATKLDVAKREVEQLLERLPESASLNLIFFNDDVQRWQHGLVPMNRGHTARACAFVRDRRAAGSTNLFDALADALADPQLDTIYLLSDGNPTVGRIVDPVALRSEIRRRNATRDVRIHVVAIGHDSPLLRHLAEDAAGMYVQR